MQNINDEMNYTILLYKNNILSNKIKTNDIEEVLKKLDLFDFDDMDVYLFGVNKDNIQNTVKVFNLIDEKLKK